MVDEFKNLVSRGDSKSAFKTLYKMAEHEVVECLVSVGATSFCSSKSKMIESNKDAVITACSK